MFERLFPHWSNPALLAAIAGMRIFINLVLTMIVAKATSATSRSTVAMVVLTVLSAVLMVIVLRDGLGLNASYLEFLLQVTLLVLTGYIVASNPENRRWRVIVAVSLGAIVLLLIMIPLYGEATVAP
ncbi:hypothetical protein [Haladaptatus halobius]|uniref:hypothetical protein n=1 Tax=Haladaptatus halobius TaxID=2884875 RepID=UPI001D0A80AD|nr:hypothetical protein [Haladaptatus halobius]